MRSKLAKEIALKASRKMNKKHLKVAKIKLFFSKELEEEQRLEEERRKREEELLLQEMNEKDKQNYLKAKVEKEEKERLRKEEELRARAEELNRALNEAKRIVNISLIFYIF